MEERRLYQRQEGRHPPPGHRQPRRTVRLHGRPHSGRGRCDGRLLFADTDGDQILGETEYALLQTISGFLGRHMET